MKRSSGLFWFYAVLLFSVLMVNPPILNAVNAYCQGTPLTFGFPTLWLWLEFWYGVMILDFLVTAIALKEWDCSQDASPIVPEEREGRA